jgi:protein-tyrosine phosphatase
MNKLEAFYISEEHGVYGFNVSGLLLAGMPIPGEKPQLWEKLQEKGILNVFCLTHDLAPYSPQKGVSLLAEKQLLDHFDGVPEADLDQEEIIIREIAERGAHRLSEGESVVAHCRGGTGRTGTVIGGILRIMGYSWEETEAGLISANKLRGKFPGGWPESEWQRELVKNW